MIDLEQTVSVRLWGRGIKRLRDLGYDLSRYERKNESCEYTIPVGTCINVKLKDIPLFSNVNVNIICDYCGNEFMGNYSTNNNYRGLSPINKQACKDCRHLKARESSSINNKPRKKVVFSHISLEELEQEFFKKDYILLKDKIVFPICDKTRLYYICNKHSDIIQNMSYSNFKQNRHCRFCGIEASKEKQKLSFEVVKKDFEDRNCVLLSDKYENTRSKLEYICLEHPDIIQAISYGSFRSGSGCYYCGLDKNRGEHNINWKGGITPISNYLRSYIDQWKYDSYQKNHNKCFITGRKKDLVIHHLYPFSYIVGETLSCLNIDIRDDIASYTQNELLLLTAKCLEIHYEKGLGVPIQNKLHIMLHSKMGQCFIDNGEFEEFRTRYLAGEFSDAL